MGSAICTSNANVLLASHASFTAAVVWRVTVVVVVVVVIVMVVVVVIVMVST